MGKFSRNRDTQPVRVPPSSKGSKPTIGEQKAAAATGKNRKIILISVCSVTVVLLFSLIFSIWFFFGWPTDDGRILNNVRAGGLDLSGMTAEEAKAFLHDTTDRTFTQMDMVIELPDTTMVLKPSETGANLDVDKIVEVAHAYGRRGTYKEREAAKEASLTTVYDIPFLDYLNLDLEYIKGKLDNYGAAYNSVYVPSSVTFDIEAPVLDSGDPDFKEDAPCQVMTLTIGAPGRNLDIEKAYNQVLDAYNANHFLVQTQPEEPEKLPEPLDVEAIYAEHRKEPVNSELNMETYEASHEVYGYDFDLKAALEKFQQATYGDTIEVPFRYLLPEVYHKELSTLLFRDVLGEYQTEHTGEARRTKNLQLACEAIDGMILNAGDTFDFNKVVGERTAAKGYRSAPAYSDGATVDTLGGGICQVSSTIYYCTLVADLEIIARSPHSYVSSYMPKGMDATVSWGGPEFIFKNNTNYPIRIDAWEEDGYVKVKLIGTDEKDYYVKMTNEVVGSQSPQTVYQEYEPNNPEGYKNGQVISTAYKGYTVKTYKERYDKETNELIERVFDQTSKYKKRDQVIVKIVYPEPDPEPEPEPEAAPDPAPESGGESE